MGIVNQFSHIGICVSDMEKSLSFYRDGLGFFEGAKVAIEDKHSALFGVSGHVKMESRFLSLGNVVIELIKFSKPAVVVSDELRPLYHTGLTHLSFQVTDLDKVASQLEQMGGKTYPSTRTIDDDEGRYGQIIFCSDPDGTRIELMDYGQVVKFA